MKILYYISFALMYLASLLPLWVLYRVSDVLYYLVYHVAGYRRVIVRKNLTESFPERSQEELRRIEKRYYSWFCDYIVETLKMFSMSDKQMRRRMRFEGLEQFEADFAGGKSLTVYLGHYCNWEWICSLGLNLSDKATPAQLYHPLESPVMDRLFFHSRGRFGAVSIPMKEAFAELVSWQKNGRLSVTGYISDQAPGFDTMHYWPMFLHHDTPAYTGAERIARILDTPVYYFDVFRPRRGYYVARAIKITGTPKTEPKFSITERYYRLLEQTIQRDPEFWLWSHNRWKRTREQFNAVHSEEERKRILSKL